jgi:hypothetical protein
LKGLLKVFICTKNEDFFCIFARASKKRSNQKNKGTLWIKPRRLGSLKDWAPKGLAPTRTGLPPTLSSNKDWAPSRITASVRIGLPQRLGFHEERIPTKSKKDFYSLKDWALLKIEI